MFPVSAFEQFDCIAKSIFANDDFSLFSKSILGCARSTGKTLMKKSHDE